MSILVIGSSNFDQFCFVDRLPVEGETILGNKIEYKFGGKGANQATAIGRLKNNITFLTSVGDDEEGRAMIENYKKSSIETKYIKTTEKSSTGSALINVDNEGNNTIIVIKGANDFCNVDYIEKHEELFKTHDYILLQLEIPLDSVYKSIELAEKYGAKVVLDPAPANIIEEDYFSKIDFLTPNETELELLAYGNIKNREMEDSVKVLLKKGVKNIIVTIGSKGAIFFNKDGKVKIDAVKVDAIDTVAAGDTFNGAFISALDKGKDIIEAIKFANKAAALTVTKIGAQEAIPTLMDIKGFYI